MTDFYPQEEGAIFDANSYIIPCYPDGAISEMSSVKPGTTVAGRISVVTSAALGDGIGIALRAASGAGVPSRIPIIFYGIVKVTFTPVVAAGEFAMNIATTAFTAGGDNTIQVSTLVWGGGASYVMGMVMQSTGGASDEALLLVGKTA